MTNSPDREPEDKIREMSVQDKRYQTIDAPTRSSLNKKRPGTNAGNFQNHKANWGSSLIGNQTDTYASSKLSTTLHSGRRKIGFSGLGPLSNASIPAVEARVPNFDFNVPEE